MSGLLEVQGLRKRFANGVQAVDGVDLTVERGRTLGLVGESGCGKSTTANLVLRLLDPDAGQIRFDGIDLLALRGRALRAIRSRMQLVPQNPRRSLNPQMRVRDSIEFNLAAQGWDRRARALRVDAMLEAVGLSQRIAAERPRELSGGQLQRVAIARALATEPDLVICDEPVSSLDKSVQAQVLNVLARLQQELGVGYLFISHDLAVVEHIADEVAVMYLGRVVETGAASEVWSSPQHPYTKALLSAVPGFGGERIRLHGDPPSPRQLPPGCGFATRCPERIDRCDEGRPELVPRVAAGHPTACIRVGQLEGGARPGRLSITHPQERQDNHEDPFVTP